MKDCVTRVSYRSGQRETKGRNRLAQENMKVLLLLPLSVLTGTQHA
jgi:hypothetical protein